MSKLDYSSAFASLRLKFLSGLPAREAELEDLTATLLEQGHTPEALDKLYFAVHKLAGICATYGLFELGGLAEKAEAIIEPMRQSTPSEEYLHRILLAVDLVSEEIDTVVHAT